MRTIDVNAWKTFYDKTSVWICIGSPLYEKDDFSVEFATNTIVVLRNNKLTSIWLKPDFI